MVYNTYPSGLYLMLFDVLLLLAAALLAYYILTQILLLPAHTTTTQTTISPAAANKSCAGTSTISSAPATATTSTAGADGGGSGSSADHQLEGATLNSLSQKPIKKGQGVSPRLQNRRKTSAFDTDEDPDFEQSSQQKGGNSVRGHRVGSISSTSINWRNKAKFYQEEVQRVNIERGKLQDELTTSKMDADIKVAQLEGDLAAALAKVDSLKKEVIELKTHAADSISADGNREQIDEQIKSYQELVAELEARLESKRELERELNDRINQLGKTNTQLLDRVRSYEEEKLEMERELLAAEEADRIAEENERAAGQQDNGGKGVGGRLRRFAGRVCPCLLMKWNGTKRVGPSVTFAVDSPRQST